MFRKSKKLVLLTAAAVLLSGGLASTASAGWGASGLGANLHRRHVLKQATRRHHQGRKVRNSAVLWFAGPSHVAFRSR